MSWVVVAGMSGCPLRVRVTLVVARKVVPVRSMATGPWRPLLGEMEVMERGGGGGSSDEDPVRMREKGWALLVRLPEWETMTW